MSREISDNAQQGRFELHEDGILAGFAEYERKPGQIVFTHTEVDSAYEGQGIGSALARGALDHVRAEGGLSVVPNCPFIKGWISKHPDYQDLVA
ncbi:GNAT family N-acetyltransferase [Actinomadura sp. 6N118]|uniref:GNAT family N-acetyltransferase n=1 Tax=Actinomadura sp. 6N118 TaxID=3375151 RepID=UPI0037BC675F